MNLFKFLVGAATITVGACAVAGKVHRDKQSAGRSAGARWGERYAV